MSSHLVGLLGKKKHPLPLNKFSRPPDWVVDLESDGMRLIMHDSGWKNTGGSFSSQFWHGFWGVHNQLSRGGFTCRKKTPHPRQKKSEGRQTGLLTWKVMESNLFCSILA
jgi:hypothetical protein